MLYTTADNLVSFPEKAGAAGAQLYPVGATSFPTVSKDGKTYTFAIRPGMKFSDGKPVTAANYARSWERVLSPKMGSPVGVNINAQDLIVGGSAFLAGKSAHISGISAKGLTLAFHLTKPNATFVSILGVERAGSGVVIGESGLVLTIGYLITEADTISGLGAAMEAGAELGVDVVRGEEVTASFPPGIHIVGLFLDRQIRMHMSVEDTVDAIHDAGGLAVIAHPFMPTWFASMTPGKARALLESRRVDGIELRHTAPVLPRTWGLLDTFYAEHRERLGAALGAGDNVAAYAQALAAGGYASDRNYAAKLEAVADSPTMSDAVAALDEAAPGQLVSAHG